MKIKLQKITVDGKQVWEWQVLQSKRVVAGGYCQTKRDANNDAQIWVKQKEENIREVEKLIGKELAY